MKIIIIVLLIFNTNIFAQKKIYVLDSKTKSVLPYVQISDGDNGAYTNEKGFFFQDKFLKKARVTHLGYESLLINFSKTDTVFLKQKTCELEEVFISSIKEKTEVAFSHINKKYFPSFPISKKNEILTVIIPNQKKIIGKLKEISFFLDKINYRKKIYSNSSKALIRLNIYKNDSLNTQIYASKAYIVKSIKKDIIKINLSDENIKIIKEGIVFGIEYIGHIDNKGMFINNEKMVIRPFFTDATNKLYNQSTLLRNSTTKKIEIPSMEKYSLKSAKQCCKKWLSKQDGFKRNLAISFIVIN